MTKSNCQRQLIRTHKAESHFKDNFYNASLVENTNSKPTSALVSLKIIVTGTFRHSAPTLTLPVTLQFSKKTYLPVTDFFHPEPKMAESDLPILVLQAPK